MKATRIVLCVLAVCLLALPAFAEGERGDMTEAERRVELRPTYDRLQNDLEYQALGRALDGNMDNREVVERYLKFLPMSPLEMLEIDMHAKRYEFMIPPHMLEWHERWLELNEKRARSFYGDEYVDRRLSTRTIWIDGRFEELPEGVSPEVATRATVGTNRNPAGSNPIAPDAYQGEIQLAVNPNNPLQIVAGANTFDSGPCGSQTQAVVYSSDGGVTWGYTCVPGDTAYPGINCTNSEFGSDPAVGWNNNNEVFLEYMLLCQGFQTQYSIVIAKSTDGGATWSGQGIIANSYASPGTIEDKQFLAIDNNPGSPFFGRMYTCWDRNNNERSAYSTNGGATWNEVDLPTPPGGGFDLGCELEVEDNGTVHLVFNTLTCGANCTNERMFYVRSTNGGVSWSSPTLVRDFNLVGFSNANCPDAQDNRCIGPFGAIGIDNSGGPCDGTLYATFTDFTSGGVNNSDIFISRSTNGGNSWSSPIQVNDDGLSNRAQFHPFLVVDQQNGWPVVAWHDARNDAGNDATDIYISRSTDCGLTWEANTQVSQPSSEFNNSGISSTNMNSSDNPSVNPNQAGEYLGLDVHNGVAYVSWSDTRMYFPSFGSDPADENFGFARVDFGSGGGNTAPSVNISSPSNGASFTQGASISFAGTATDAEDGTLTSSLSWNSSLDGNIGSGGSFSSSSLSVGSHTITASVTDSGSLSGNDSVNITVSSPGGGCTGCIDWNVTGTVSFATQDASSNVTVEDGGDTLFLQQNTWRRTTQTYAVTANTVVEFDFLSTSEGEIHGIGLDEDNNLSSNRIFKVHGTQNYGNTDFDNYPGSGWVTYQIPVGQYYTGSSFFLVLVNDKDAGALNNNSRFRNVRIFEDTPGGGSCTVDDDFEGGAAGWSTSGTCSTGTFVLGTPSQQTNSGVTTQVGGAASGSNALFTATNTSAGNADVDGGECVVTSPSFSVSAASDLDINYFHGQRDAGDDANDYFVLEYSTNGGSSYSSIVSIGDVQNNAAWTAAPTTSIPAGSNVIVRVRVSDGAGPGDLVEGGIDDLAICDQ